MGKDCPPWFNWVILLVGILYLLADLGTADVLGGIQWYTVVFLLWGLAGVMKK